MVYTQKYLTTADWTSFRKLTPTTTTTPSLAQVESFIEIAESEFESSVGDYSLHSGYDVVCIGRAHGITVKEPVTALNSLSISNGDLITPTWTILNSTDYVLKSDGRILIREPYVNREYKANIDSGYAVANVPMNIKYLIYLMSMRRAFNAHLFESNVSDSTTRIIDVEVYREITNGGDPFKGFGSLDMMINEEKANIKGRLRTRLG